MKILKTLPVWLIALFAIGGVAFGALVNYLSNTQTYSATIESPIAIGDISGSGTIHGGDTQTYSYTVTNNANNDITGDFIFIIHEPDTATEDDLSDYSFTYGDQSYDVTISTEGNDLKLVASGVTIEAGSENVQATWSLTFNPAIEPGDYSFETYVAPTAG